ncbi:50S ribosomal protein L29 [Desulfonatronovibrio hydrogenovorans]|uniref:50S ribosomal protein L29 n=1 Tax=Desulfonatronovibrio hydrogenovorans TaxID=53245 RepID=UPI00048F0E54|nr:50S ribosomal protein L29 [Desulfonatronovibrio hydrogenovorans]
MKPQEIRDLSGSELQEKLQDFRQELFNLRFQHSTAQLENTQRLAQVKKIIARILTIINEKKTGTGHGK